MGNVKSQRYDVSDIAFKCDTRKANLTYNYISIQYSPNTVSRLLHPGKALS